jgi:hypothetical protein
MMEFAHEGAIIFNLLVAGVLTLVLGAIALVLLVIATIVNIAARILIYTLVGRTGASQRVG